MTETNGMKIVERINEICKKKGIVRKKIAQDLDIADNSFSTWSARGTIPAADIALKIAQYLNVSIEWLITGEEKGLTLQEREILSKWQELEEEQKETVTVLLNTLIEQNHKKEKSARAGA